MEGPPLVLEKLNKCNSTFFNKKIKIFGSKIDIKIILIITGLVILFFFFVYPSFKNTKEHGPITNAMDALMGRRIQNFIPNLAGAADALLGFPQKSKSLEHMTPGCKKIEHYSPEEEMFNNLLSMSDQELRIYMGSLDEIQKKTIKESLGSDRINKLNEKMGGRILETMSDYVKPDNVDAFGALSPVHSDETDKYKLQDMMCSKSCCSPQWGVTPEEDDRIKANDLGTKFFPTNYTCDGNNVGDHGNGCVCVSKDAFSYLGNRGGNNIEQ
jgi:hypothetical protein